ncbi:E2 domain-containing protein [Leisingera sp. JC1]|uniref:E2 domain-containing protein n=1 Tax=Leisingera sp. JC1 TaxID=1855282 RepID=UPI001130CA6C|nr:E2 domain-containing protein [Leisingera sp. JC1]
MSSLKRLLEAKPAWAELTNEGADELVFVVTPSGSRKTQLRTFKLKVRSYGQNRVSVEEQRADAQLPLCCVERHINPDATFCLGYNSEAPIESVEKAEDWWASLHAYLNNQRYAEKFGVWPLASGLSHGSAAIDQLKMEEIAKSLGWLDEVRTSIFRAKGWLSGALPRLSKDKATLVNARSPCPRGCRKKHKRHRRFSCETDECFDGCNRAHRAILRADCPNRVAVEKLVLLEHRRRKTEEKLISEVVRTGMKCCGTMKNCPLPKG